MPNRSGQPALDRSPLDRFLEAGGITSVVLSAMSGVHMAAIAKLRADDDRLLNLPLSTLIRVAHCLGVAPVELLPMLGKRPRTGMLWDRGVLKREKAQKTPK